MQEMRESPTTPHMQNLYWGKREIYHTSDQKA